VIDEGTEYGALVARHLREDVVVWLTTVTPDGAPMPSPVWFIWDGADQLVVYSLPTPRVRNVRSNPQVTLNFNTDEYAEHVVVLSGRAAVDDSLPPADRSEDYLAKYRSLIGGLGMTPEMFAERFATPIRIRLTHVRGH
jgi:PPOX class probable F420-dependent enzyme